MPSPRVVRRCLAASVALLVLVGFTPGAPASLRERLTRQKSNLATLTARIQVEEARAQRRADAIARLEGRIARAGAEAEQLSTQLKAAKARVAEVQGEYDRLVGKLGEMARQAFMRQPGGQLGTFLTVVIGSGSLGELSDGFVYAAKAGEAMGRLTAEVAAVHDELAARAAELRSLTARKEALLSRLHEQQRRKKQAEAEQQQALQRLDRTRQRIVEAVSGLQYRLLARDIARIAASLQGVAQAPYGRWARLFLRYMRVPTCHANLVVMVAWQLSEFTQAAWNPLATTRGMPGSTTFNTAGVQSFASLGQGLEATKLTLVEGWSKYRYGAIVASLRACDAPITTAQAINASGWCHGCANGTYVTGTVAKVEANYDLYAQL